MTKVSTMSAVELIAATRNKLSATVIADGGLVDVEGRASVHQGWVSIEYSLRDDPKKILRLETRAARSKAFTVVVPVVRPGMLYPPLDKLVRALGLNVAGLKPTDICITSSYTKTENPAFDQEFHLEAVLARDKVKKQITVLTCTLSPEMMSQFHRQWQVSSVIKEISEAIAHKIRVTDAVDFALELANLAMWLEADLRGMPRVTDDPSYQISPSNTHILVIKEDHGVVFSIHVLDDTSYNVSLSNRITRLFARWERVNYIV